jgi:DNA-binding transcriptional ArsR family regulator
MKAYIVKEKEGKLIYSNALILENAESLNLINHEIRIRILELLNKKPMYPAELAKELKMHEQKVYYHIKQLTNSGILEIAEKKEIRGTTAKKFRPKQMNFAVTLSKEWTEIDELLKEKDYRIMRFFEPFIQNNKLNAAIVVGSPDPHGPFKARARDGHYAIDLAIFLGSLCSVGDEFSVKLDVDVDLKTSKNLIVVGGPVTNLVCQKINDFLPSKFSDKKPWGIVTESGAYTEETAGFIARVPNPYNQDYKVLVIAGIRYLGTKAAVMALTKFSKLILDKFKNEKEFYCVVQGFDMDGDGKIDNVEVLE